MRRPPGHIPPNRQSRYDAARLPLWPLTMEPKKGVTPMRSGTAQAMFVIAATLLWLTGCPSPANHSEKKPSADTHDHEHDHAHHGPHHGHLMEIGQEEYHAEWTHDESGKIPIYNLGSDAK